MCRPPLAYPLAALAAFGALLALVATDWAPLVELDTATSARARAFGTAHPAWVAALRAITDAGATVSFVAAGIVITAVLLWRRRYGRAVAVGLAVVVTPVLWSLTHLWLTRPRPVDGFVSVDSNGFPSGHTTHVTVAGLLAVLLLWSGLGRLGRAAVVSAAVLVAVVIGVSRAALLAHWPSDVLGGWLLGVGVAALCVAVADRRPVGDQRRRPADER